MRFPQFEMWMFFKILPHVYCKKDKKTPPSYSKTVDFMKNLIDLWFRKWISVFPAEKKLPIDPVFSNSVNYFLKCQS